MQDQIASPQRPAPARLRPDRLFAGIVLGCAPIPSLLMAVSIWLVHARGLLTMDGHLLVVRDYVWLWGAGQHLKAADVATIFHPAAFADWLRSVWGPQFDDHVWGYPPSMLFLALPAGHLPIRLGFAFYVAAQVALLWSLGRHAGLSRALLAAILVSPAMLESSMASQNGAITGSLMMAGLLLAGRRPIASGICLGLLTIKPQFGLLVPICLIASRDWRTILSACLTFLALFLASGALFGFDSWRMFLENTLPFVSGQLQTPWANMYYQRLLVTPFALMRFLGFGLTPSFAFQAMFSVSAAVLTWRLWRRPGVDPELRAAVTVCLAMLATPYGYAYDMVGVAIAVAILASRAVARPLPLERLVLAFGWIWPGIAAGAAVMLAPLGFAVIAAVAWVGERRLSQGLASKRQAPMPILSAI